MREIIIFRFVVVIIFGVEDVHFGESVAAPICVYSNPNNSSVLNSLHMFGMKTSFVALK